jgi:hypothetical protein
VEQLSAWFGNIIGSTYNYNALGFNELTINHLDRLN